MEKQKTTKDFFKWALEKLKYYEREVNKLATLVLAGVADTSLEYSVGALESLLVNFVYRYGVSDEREYYLVNPNNIGGIRNLLEKYSKDKHTQQLDPLFIKIWGVYSEHLLTDRVPRDK